VPATKWLAVADGAGDQTVDQDPVYALVYGPQKMGFGDLKEETITTIFFSLLIALVVITAVVQRF